jgi:hypothetical protein
MINGLPYQPAQVKNNQPDFTKTSQWFKQTYAASYKAGGDPPGVLDKFPEELLDTLVRNGIYLTNKA